MPQVQVPQPPVRVVVSRPRRERDEYGMKRTPLEIWEGTIYKAYALDPSNPEKREAAWDAWEKLTRQEGIPTPVRCQWCYTVRSERPYRTPCDVCGYINPTAEEIMAYEETSDSRA